MIFGLISVGITFLFGFVGTFFIRFFIIKQRNQKILLATGAHLAITVVLIVPIIGWFIYLVGTLWFVYTNFRLVLIKYS